MATREELLRELIKGSDVMSPAARAEYKKATGEDVLLGAPTESTTSTTSSSVLEHMNEIYAESQALTKQREAEAAATRKAIIDKYKPIPAHEKLLTETANAITTIFKSNTAALKEALSNKNFIPELIDVIRSSSADKSKDTSNTSGKGK